MYVVAQFHLSENQLVSCRGDGPLRSLRLCCGLCGLDALLRYICPTPSNAVFWLFQMRRTKGWYGLTFFVFKNIHRTQ